MMMNGKEELRFVPLQGGKEDVKMLFPSLLGNTKLDITQVTYAEVGKAFNPKTTRQRVV